MTSRPTIQAPRAGLAEAAAFTPLPLPRGVVRRPRLEQCLDAGVRTPLTLVASPAGTGKTVLAASWVADQRAGTAVWVSVEEDAAEPATFWQHVVTGLARAGVAVPSSFLPGPGSLDHSAVYPLAEGVMAHEEPVILVLDCDASLTIDIADPLDSLLHQAGGCLRVVLLAREDPLLPLHRYRLADSLVEVRMADLAFTAGEAVQMFEGMGVDLSPSALDATMARTQGWAAGLRMAGMAMAHREDTEAAARQLAGDTGTVAEYLLAEVLDAQSDGSRQLMLDTSIVDLLWPGLATALAGPHADRALSFLVHGNAFVEELPERPGSYRYHLLFRELLRAQLAYESPERVVELHRVAATWLSENGLVEDAVRHALTIHDWELAARLAVDDLSIVPLLAGEPTDRLNDALARIPRTADGTAVTVVNAARAVALGDHRGAASGLRRAHMLLDRAPGGSWPAGELAVAVVELVQAREAGDADAALDSAAHAQDLIPVQEPERWAAHPELGAVIQCNLGAALVIAGRLQEAADAYLAATEGDATGRQVSLTDALGQGALLAALRGDLRQSEDLARQVISMRAARGPHADGADSAAEAALAYVHTERYNLGAGRHHAARAAAREPAAHEALQTVVLALARARISRAGRDLKGARAILEHSRAHPGLPAWLTDLLDMERVGVLVADGESGRAVGVAEAMTDPAAQRSGLLLAAGTPAPAGDVPTTAPSPAAPVPAPVDALVHSATRHALDGQEKRAVRELEHALRLAAPELSRRAFREAPAELWRLLRQHHELLLRHTWLTNRHLEPPGGVTVPRPRGLPGSEPTREEPIHVYEVLTDKEREVLGRLSELLTTEEIAATMFISVNTVRTHVRNILRKLAASRRNEAVRRARDLGII